MREEWDNNNVHEGTSEEDKYLTNYCE